MGFLIASIDVSAEQREALLSLLPQMTEDQLDELAGVLEVDYLQAGTKQQDEKFVSDLKKVEQKHEQNIRQINDHAAQELDAIA